MNNDLIFGVSDPVSPGDLPALRDWLPRAAIAAGMQEAILGPEGSLTYRQLYEAVQGLSSQIQLAGLERGDRVALAATRSLESIVAILACVDAGVAYVPLDLSYPAERLQAMWEDASPRLVLGDAVALATLAKAVGSVPVLSAPAPKQHSVFGAEADLTYVLFTSGSTGRPKGVAMGAAPLQSLIAWHAAHPRLGRTARTLQFAPLSFDVHCQEIFSTIACRGTLIILPEAVRRDPSLLHAALIKHSVERVFVPYVALQMIAEASRTQVPPALRDVVSAGEQLQITPAIRSLFQRLPGAELHNHYGPTESHVVTAFELQGDAALWPAIPPIGKALPHVEVALCDPDTGAVSEASSGELLLGGNTLAHGYLGRPELSSERFRTNIPGLQGAGT